MIVSQPNRALRVRSTEGRGDQQTVMEVFEIEAPVEAIGESGEVSSGILWEIERMVATGETGLEVAEHGVNPLKLGQVLWLAPGDDGGLVRATGLGDGAETGQPIREHRTARREVALGPLCDRLERKTWNRREFGTQGMAIAR